MLSRFGASPASKINSGRVSSADKDPDTLARLRFVPAGEERCESGSATGFRDDTQNFPECLLGLLNRVVRHEDCAAHKLLSDREH